MRSILQLAIWAALGASCQAQALGSIADVTIVDRDSGAALTPHFYRGEYWVAGRPGARYAIDIRNQLGERVLAVTSVDGVNVISGETAAFDQTGYVFNAGVSYEIDGWRKSDAEVAAFLFTDSANSYAERTGRPANVGVIGVALFREKRAAFYSPPPAILQPPSAAPAAPAAPAARAGAAPPSTSAGTSADAAASAGLGASAQPGAATEALVRPPAAKLGTGHGEREYSFVSRTEFVRMQAQPNEVVRIHYDSLENLVAMGIIRRPRPQPLPPGTNPFPGSPDRQYVPDPPG
jgi:hypothetical protein